MKIDLRMLVLVLAACSSEQPPATAPDRQPVAIVTATANKAVDVLFLIDDSTNTLDAQNNLKANFPAFINVLNEHGLPDLHIGVATSDLGTSAAGDPAPGPPIGTGAGMCAATGKAGHLQTSGSAVVTGNFISDVSSPDGSRATNYTGTLADAFSSIASVGATGCGFEQHLEAVKRALDSSNPENAGFLRPDASLAVIVLADEDDCSLEHASLIGNDTTTFGPLQSFRCTRFGITCDDGGLTPDAMNTPGHKDLCHSNEQSPYLTHVAGHVAFLKSLKPDPRMVMVGAIVGDPRPVDVELRSPPGSTTPIPALAHSCEYTDVSNSAEVADPAVRIAELAGSFDRNVVGSVCQQDVSAPLVAIARQINSMTGSPCLVRDIAMPADCVVTDDAGPVTDYTLVTDPAMCPDGQHLRLERGGTATGTTVVSCTAPE
jgi:hypothetical protein